MKIAVLGGGSWGSALALVCYRASHEVVIYSRNQQVCNEINNQHVNLSNLPDIVFPSNIIAYSQLSEILSADIFLLVTPAQSIRKICLELKELNINSNKTLIICAKGIEQKSYKLMSEVVKEILPNNPIAILSGPNFALEIAKDLPAITSIASEDYNFSVTLSGYLSSKHFRVYPNDDIIGTQVIGAAKNVLAIATGIVMGKNLGENTKAAVISRGVNEITNLLLAKGGKIETLISPAGFGDIHLTCSSSTSRNTAYGIDLGKNNANQKNALVEGFYSAESLYMLSSFLDVKMPICKAIYKVVHQNMSLDHVIYELLERPRDISLINARK